MRQDVQSVMRDTVLRALEHAGAGGGRSRGKGGSSSGVKGLIAGAGAAALLPLAFKGAGKLTGGLGGDGDSPQEALSGFASKLGDRVGGGIGEKVSAKVDEAGGPGGILKDALPFGGGSDDDDDQDQAHGAAGAGKGRRMPVQQSVDIGAPLETVYNQWTQFEDWPNFMHRVTRVTQEDDCTITFSTKIWGKTKEFTAQIDTQRPDERIRWRVSRGMTHRGVVTFHELGPNLTRVLLNMDVEPGGPLEKAARGMRHVKRAARADLHRFKAFVEMAGQETGAWRGVIEHAEVVQEHDPGYDRKRQYADIDALLEGSYEDQDVGEAEGQDEDDGEPSRGRSRGRAQSSRSQSRPASGRSSQNRKSSGQKARSGSGGDSQASTARSRGDAHRSGNASQSGSGSGRRSSGRSSSGRRQSRSRSGHDS